MITSTATCVHINDDGDDTSVFLYQWWWWWHTCVHINDEDSPVMVMTHLFLYQWWLWWWSRLKIIMSHVSFPLWPKTWSLKMHILFGNHFWCLDLLKSWKSTQSWSKNTRNAHFWIQTFVQSVHCGSCDISCPLTARKLPCMPPVPCTLRPAHCAYRIPCTFYIAHCILLIVHILHSFHCT